MAVQTDRGPGTVDPDGPRSARGLWRLTRIPGVAAVRARRIADALPTWAALADADRPTLLRLGVAGLADRLRTVPDVSLPRTLDGIVLSAFDARYPAHLAAIPNPPALLWVEGSLPPDPGIAVVGTRTPSAYGCRVAHRAAHEVAATGAVLISGMADGVDQIAERTAVAAGGRVVSVLGGGLDRVPPRLAEHRDAILAAGGAVISEQPPGSAPTRPSLDARDRIQSGLSHTVVVAQAGLGGGTSATVRFALVHGRRLVVPRPEPDSRHAADPESARIMALGDPAGIDPAVLGLSGRQGARVANRRPVADVVGRTGAELAAALRSPSGMIAP